VSMNGSGGIADRIDMKAAARAVGVGRIALGLSYLAAPGLALRAWPGRRSTKDDDGALLKLLARSTGGRDIALGMGLLFALSHDAPVRGWLEAAMLADVVDALAILLALPHLPKPKAVLMLGAALGTAAAGRRLATSLG
jgi:hypothetical protein